MGSHGSRISRSTGDLGAGCLNVMGPTGCCPRLAFIDPSGCEVPAALRAAVPTDPDCGRGTAQTRPSMGNPGLLQAAHTMDRVTDRIGSACLIFLNGEGGHAQA